MTITFQRFFGNVDFSAEILSDNDETPGIPAYSYPGAIPDAWVPGISVMVKNASDVGSWVGHFRQGRESPNGAQLCCAHPDGKNLVVVSRGAPFVVQVKHPAVWKELSVRPVLGYGVAAAEGVLVLYGFSTMMGLRSDGTLWTSRQLSWDEVRDVKVTNGKITGAGWDAPTSSFFPFEVDAWTGESVGGSAPP